MRTPKIAMRIIAMMMAMDIALVRLRRISSRSSIIFPNDKYHP